MANNQWLALLRQHPTVPFLTAVLLMYAAVGLYGVIGQPPQSIHMEAQTDRASVAANYHQENLNFFKPRIHNVDNDTGRVGLEFPLMNYLAALLYELFGFNDSLYRLLMLLVATGGILAAFKLANRFLNTPLLAGVVTLLWASSPLMHYYMPNFLPGMASLSFAMAAWWLFFRPSAGWGSWLAFFGVVTLAGLVKITSGITIIAMLILVSAKRLFPEKTGHAMPEIPGNRRTLFALLGSVVLIGAWYGYSAYLKNFYESHYFLMKLKPLTSWETFKEVADTFVYLWGDALYSPLLYLLVGGSLGLVLLKVRQLSPALLAVTTLLLLGTGGFGFLMFTQLKHHDYYLLPLMLLPFFLLLSAAWLGQRLLQQRQAPPWWRYGLTSLLALVLIPGWLHSRGVQASRYEGGLQQRGVDYEPYTTLAPKLRAHGISQEDQVISLVDRSPNISLYQMNRRGVTMREDLNQGKLVYRLYQRGDYLVVDDTSMLRFPAVHRFLDSPVIRHQSVAVYPVALEAEQRQAFLDSMLATFQPMIDHYWLPEAYQERIREYHHFGLSLTEARVRQAYGIYGWILDSMIAPKLAEHFPEELNPGAKPITIARFVQENRSAVKQLHSEGELGDKEWGILRCQLPLFLYDYGV
jgi:hypothetical protein